MIGLAAAAAYTAANLPSDNTLSTMRSQLARAMTARGWPAEVQRQANARAAQADDGEELGELTAWLGSQPYPGAPKIADIVSTAAGAGRYSESLGSVLQFGVEGALEDVSALVGAGRSVAAAGGQGARRLLSSPPLLVTLLAAAGGLIYALRR